MQIPFLSRICTSHGTRERRANCLRSFDNFREKRTEILFHPLHIVVCRSSCDDFRIFPVTLGCEHGDKKCEIANNGSACVHVDCGTLSSLMMKY